MKLWRGYDIKKGDRIYLKRFFLWRSKRGGLFLHNIRLHDDDRDPHDHPWDFKSFVVWGGYTEARYNRQGSLTIEERKRWTFAARRATDIHRIVSVLPNTWTLIFLGPRVREWGFWKWNGFSKEWIRWKEYLGIKPGTEVELD